MGKPSVKMKEGELQSAGNRVLSGAVDLGATVNLTVFTRVTDKDKGLNGKDESGEATKTLTFTCTGTSFKKLETSVTLENSKNKDKGKVLVTTKAVWKEVQ